MFTAPCIQSESNLLALSQAKKLLKVIKLNGQNNSTGTVTDEVCPPRRDDCPSFCDLIGRGQSLAKSGHGNGLGRSENKRPETRR
ncbi:hypothetical protein TNCV_2663801 [Trichonephila clavipes]|nr:hypothetical protein TNCV_2663801 [Trichonephila clavipes]